MAGNLQHFVGAILGNTGYVRQREAEFDPTPRSRQLVLRELEAASAVRVSLGLDTTEDEVLRFADAWTQKLRKHEARAA